MVVRSGKGDLLPLPGDYGRRGKLIPPSDWGFIGQAQGIPYDAYAFADFRRELYLLSGFGVGLDNLLVEDLDDWGPWSEGLNITVNGMAYAYNDGGGMPVFSPELTFNMIVDGFSVIFYCDAGIAPAGGTVDIYMSQNGLFDGAYNASFATASDASPIMNIATFEGAVGTNRAHSQTGQFSRLFTVGISMRQFATITLAVTDQTPLVYAPVPPLFFSDTFDQIAIRLSDIQNITNNPLYIRQMHVYIPRLNDTELNNRVQANVEYTPQS